MWLSVGLTLCSWNKVCCISDKLNNDHAKEREIDPKPSFKTLKNTSTSKSLSTQKT